MDKTDSIKDLASLFASLEKNLLPDRTEESCWIWQGYCDPHGYACLKYHKKNYRAQRLMWFACYGPIPDGLQVLHNCPDGDNPSCVNPEHLFLGSNGDNRADAKKKGQVASGKRNGAFTHPERRPYGERNGTHTHPEQVRRGDAHYSRFSPERLARGARNGASTHPETRARGERHGNAKLTKEIVYEIRRLCAEGVSGKVLASQFNVNVSTINRANSKTYWKHIA